MDSRDSNVQQNMPTFCKNGCGFYAASGNEGLCSVCYKEAVKKKQAPPTNMPASFTSTASSSMSPKEEGASASTASSLETAQPTVPSLRPQPETEVKETSEAGGASSAAVSGASGEEDRGQDGKKKKNRCGVCKKKVGLTGFTCRCGGLFCSIHRYSDKHECKFDYKAMGAEEIAKSNPVIMAQKVAKI